MYQPAYRRSFRTLGLVCLACLMIASSLSAQPIPNRESPIRLTAHRPPAGRPTGLRALARANLLRVRGVLSQTTELTFTGGEASVAIALTSSSEYPGYIAVRLNGSPTSYHYPIAYSDLVPMALFIDAGGTTLYTLPDPDAPAASSFASDAGLVDHRLDGMVALELRGTRYADAMYFLDTCIGCVEPADDDITRLVDDLNAADPSPASADFLEMLRLSTTYINTDIGLSYQITTRDTRLRVNGTILRLHPDPSPRSSIREAERIATPANLVAATRRQLSRLEAEVQETRTSMLQSLSEALSADDAIEELTFFRVQNAMLATLPVELSALITEPLLRQQVLLEDKLEDAFFLFETLALLRSARLSAPAQWAEFRQALASDALVRQHPEAWERYSESYCSIYGDKDECNR